MQDDLARSRRREAVWISIIVHLVLIIGLWKIEFLAKYLPWHPDAVAKKSTNLKDVTFLELPPDLQKVPQKPNTNIISDKNRVERASIRIWMSKSCARLWRAPPPGASGLSAPQPAPAQPSASAAQSQPAPQQAPTPQIAQLQTPKLDLRNEFNKYGGSMSAGDDSGGGPGAKRGGGGQGSGGDFGLGTGQRGRQVTGNLEILSDTMGVDFGPYLQRVLHDVRQNWYNAIPESAEMKHGNLIIEFAITKDGKVAGMKLVATSGDVPLDRAAWAGIAGSDPFPALPSDFGGPYLALRFRFYYNPTKEEREGLE